MGKLPYIKWYVGDYLKDTRVLPLNARGVWVDLLMFIWNEPEISGSITATHEEFSRMVGCSLDEWMKAFDLLKQKKIFDCSLLDGNLVKITSRKITSILELSATRSESGKLGGNPKLLVKQKVKHNDKQDLNQNPEYESEHNNSEVVKEEFTIKLSKKVSDKLREKNAKQLTEMKKSAIKLLIAEGKKEDEAISEANKIILRDIGLYEKFMSWVDENASSVNDLKEPFSIRQYTQFKLERPDPEIRKKILSALHNWPPLTKKRKQAFTTALNWQLDGN